MSSLFIIIFWDDEDQDAFINRLGQVLINTRTDCFAWALIPNHVHLLLRTGNVPMATVMRRLLTGYAVQFNRRHRSHGHVFQNRYKSILCQQDPYLKELVRYIHSAKRGEKIKKKGSNCIMSIINKSIPVPYCPTERKDVEFKLYPTLNHIFMEVDGKSTGAEYQQPGNVAAAVVNDIADWINRNQ